MSDTKKLTAHEHPSYPVWQGMRARCNNPKNKSFKWYGAKGIKVCPRWASFDTFASDMGPRLPGMTLDRIDPCGNYEPSNCRWTTVSHQGLNKSNTIMVSDDGIVKALSKLALDNGISISTMFVRHAKNQPLMTHSRPRKIQPSVFDGFVKTITREYWAWCAMRKRCKPNTKYINYANIKVCDRWANFSDFIEDMGKCPVGCSLDRIDNTGNYEPANCRWATATMQIRNRRTTPFLTIEGQSKPISEWSDISGIPFQRISQRLHAGWDAAKAVFEPINLSFVPALAKPLLVE